MTRLTNAHIYLAIAEDALVAAQKLDAENISPKPNEVLGSIIKYDPEQKSLKHSLISIAFSCNYLEAVFYLSDTKKFGKEQYEKFDKKSYEEKLPIFGITDQNLIDAAKKLRKTRQSLTHEKAKDISEIRPEDWRIAQDEAKDAVTLVKEIAKIISSQVK